MPELRPDVARAVRLGGVLLAVLFGVFLLRALVPFGGDGVDTVFNTWIYDSLIFAAAISCFARSILVRRERLAWALMGIALAAWTSGEIYYSIAFAGSETAPIPSPADAGYLAFYPFAYASLILLLRARLRDFGGARWLDGIIVGSAVAAIATAVAMDPIVAASTSGSTAEAVTNLAYPVADLALLSLIVTAAAFAGWRLPLGLAALGLGLAVLAISDGLYLLQSAQETYVEGGLLDAAWPLGALLLAAAAWSSPDSRPLSQQGSVRAIAVPTIAALAAIGLQFADRNSNISDLAAAFALLTLLSVVVRLVLSFRENQTTLDASVREASTDFLTGLGNRRLLMADLETAVATEPGSGRVRLLAIFDLDGFKAYNDSFGHPAGDALLERLGRRLERFASGRASVYRLGGDEFCLLGECVAEDVDGLVAGAAATLCERGEGFVVTASHGSAIIPTEASSRETALQLADRRMYARKSGGRASAGTQSRDVLLSALRERRPDLHEHLSDVADLVVGVADELRMNAEQRDEVIRAAELHDTGKMAIPDAILNKPGPLDEREWEFMRAHTVIGERIIASAPALIPVAGLVRSSHENWDGSGYPDGLREEEIPLGSRLVAVCDAYGAMTSKRPYGEQRSPAEALAELRRCAGTQFDPSVVAAFERALAKGAEAPVSPARARQPGPRSRR